MKAFITGMAGFVGSHLLEHLLDCGDRVIGSALDSQWDAATASRDVRAVELLGWDLRSEPSRSVRKSLAEFSPDCIYYLAAVSIPQHCGEEEPTELARQVNVEGTERVLELAASLPSNPRVLVVSSSYVYGKANPAAPRVDELTPLAPHRGYGKSKFAAEQLALAAVAAGKVDCVIARPFNHTGPRQTPEMMLPQWAQQFAADDRKPINVHTLDAWLDLTDVRDVVRAYRLLIEHGETGSIYNVGGGVMRRSGDVFRRLHDLAGGNREYHETMPGLRQQTIADCTKLHRATRWRPEIPLWRTIEDTLAYWQHRMQGR